MQLVFTDQAISDLAALRAYIAHENPTAARGPAHKIRSRISLLGEYSLLGRPGRVEGQREPVITGTRYSAAYLVASDVIRILAYR